MAKKYDNNKGFLIIQLELLDAALLCGISNRCDNCNNEIDVFAEEDYCDIYYVAVINRAICKECLDDFIKNYDRCEEDIPYEIKHYNYYAKKLGLEEV